MKDHNYGIDQLRESMVKILQDDGKTIAGSGFIIRSDGYLITCHHVIYLLNSLKVEYHGQIYEAQWCQELSNPEVDIAILKIDVRDAKAVPIVDLLQEVPTSVTVYGFPGESSIKRKFPEGLDVSAQNIHPSAPINTFSTYLIRETKFNNAWNKLPKPESTFLSHRIDAKVELGTSGGPVFAEDLGGVVGVIQCSKSDESYVIRWDNITETLNKLGLEPGKNAACRFLQEIEEEFKYIKLFHSPQKIVLEDQYIPIEVTLERKYRHEVETSLGYAESDEELKRAYALKGMDEESQPSQVPWEEAKKQHQRIMVLADPGMGKSTLLNMEALSTAQGEKQQLLDNKKSVDDVIFPITLTLSQLDKEEKPILNAMLDLTKQRYPETSKGIIYLLEKKLKEGNCLLLLDALDEVPKEHRNNLSEKLDIFARNYSCPIICTSRIVGYGGAFVADAEEVEIVPFRQEQIEQYVKTWFTNAAGSINDASVSADGLLRELRNKPQIRGLSQNPLLLSLLCSLYQEKKLTLPARRCQVYEKAVDYMLSKWSQNRRPQSEGRIRAKVRLLEELAYHFTYEGKEIFSTDNLYERIEEYLQGERVPTDFRDSTTSDLITELSEEDGIIQLEKNGERYLFLHRTFQEYLTASYLNRAIQKNQSDGIDLAKEHFWEYDWHETLGLLAGLMKDPVPLLQAITDEKDDIFGSLLLLAGRCIAECEENSHPLVVEIIDRSYGFWRTYPYLDFINSTIVAIGQANSQMTGRLQKVLNDGDNSVKWQATNALGKIGSEQAVEALIQAITGQDRKVRNWSAQALKEIDNPQVVDVLIQALNNRDVLVRRSATRVLGKISDSQAMEALIQALNDQDEFVRVFAAEALGKIGSSGSVKALIHALSDQYSRVREWAAWALKSIGSPQAVEALTQILTDSDRYTRKQALEALGAIGTPGAVEKLIQSGVNFQKVEILEKIGSPQAVEGLIHALNHGDRTVRSRAADALGNIGSPQAVEGLIHTLNHNDSIFRWEIISLGMISNPQAVDTLIKALNHENIIVKMQAAQALGKIKSPKAINPLIQVLSNPDSNVRVKIATALGQIGSPQAINPLIQTLNDEDSVVREDAVRALGRIGNPQVIEVLGQALNDEDINVRQAVVRALEIIGSSQAVEVLIRALNDEDSSVRARIVYTLGNIGSPQAVDALIHALNDEYSGVRILAVEALGKIGNPHVVDALIRVLNRHEDSDIREKVIKALGEIGNKQAVDALIQALKDESTGIKEEAAKALVKIDNLETLETLIQSPEINIYDPEIFSLARTLAVRFSKEKTPFIPVYPELIGKRNA